MIFHGCFAKYYDGTVPLSQSVPNTTFYAVKYNYTGPAQRCIDTDNFHPHNTESNLGGTCAKTATSAVIVGTGTTFTSLTEGDAIRVAGGETYTPEIFVVKTITDNTHFTAYQTAVQTASGVTGVKDSTAFVVPPGLLPNDTDSFPFGGRVNINFRANTTGVREINIGYNGMEAGLGAGSNSNLDEQQFISAPSSGEWASTIPWNALLKTGDYVQVIVYQNSTGSLEIACDLPGIPFSMIWQGTLP